MDLEGVLCWANARTPESAALTTPPDLSGKHDKPDTISVVMKTNFLMT